MDSEGSYRVYNSQPPVPILSHITTVHASLIPVPEYLS